MLLKGVEKRHSFIDMSYITWLSAAPSLWCYISHRAGEFTTCLTIVEVDVQGAIYCKEMKIPTVFTSQLFNIKNNQLFAMQCVFKNIK
jgi:hypothetical protein